MDRRKFNSLMHLNNERWVAQALNMQVNPSKGPDLIDSEKVVEVKFTLSYKDKYRHLSWRVLGYQLDYDCCSWKSAYWVLGTYSLDRPISSIRNSDPRELEKMTVDREVSLVKWDWMFQFPSYFECGKTEFSEWAHCILFPKGRLLPKRTQTYQVNGGKVHFTKGVDPKKFRIATS